VSKFIPEHDSRCTLCVKSVGYGPHPQETFEHIFYSCPVTEIYRKTFIEEFFPEIRNVDQNVGKNFWFFGLSPDNKKNLFISSVISLVNHWIWETKLKKTILPVSTFKNDICFYIFKLVKSSVKIRDAKIAANYEICRREFRPP